MLNENSTFHFELSHAELNWLSGAFGLTQLPLLADSLSGLTIAEREVELRKAQDTLQHRSLIRRVPGQGWEVDRIPAAIVRWLGSAVSMQKIEIHTRAGAASCAYFFAEAGASMQITMGPVSYQILFLPAGGDPIHEMLHSLGISLRAAIQHAEYRLVQPTTILCTAWKDETLAEKMLMIADIPKEEIRSSLAWARDLEWLVALQHIQLEGNQTHKQTILCGGAQGCWKANLSSTIDAQVVFFPVGTEEIRNPFQTLSQV